MGKKAPLQLQADKVQKEVERRAGAMAGVTEDVKVAEQELNEAQSAVQDLQGSAGSSLLKSWTPS